MGMVMGQYCSVIYNARKRAVYFSVQEVILTLAITHAHHLVIANAAAVQCDGKFLCTFIMYM